MFVRVALFLKQSDFYVALLTCAVAALVPGHSFNQIGQHHRNARMFEHPLEEGVKEFSVFGPTGCVGKLSIALERSQGEMALKINATLRTSYQARPATLELGGDLAFNLIGQMGGGIVRLAIAEQNFTIGFEDINPIRVTFISPVLGGKGRREFAVPGPFELVPLSSGKYQVRYVPLGQRSTPLGGIAERYSQLLGLRIESGTTAAELCSKDDRSALSLDSFGAQLQQQVGGILKLLPAAATGGAGGLQ